MLTVLNFVKLVLILNLLIISSCGNNEIIKKYPVPSNYVEDELRGTTSQTPSGQSSSGVLSTDGPISIIVNKHTKDLRTEYDKTENITIRIRFLNCNKLNRIESASLREEIPEGFDILNLSINTNCESNNYYYTTPDNINMSVWAFNKELPDVKYIEYTIRGHKSGLHCLAGTILTASVIDYKGVRHQIVAASDDLVLHIKNDPPELIKYSQDNPTYLQHGSALKIQACFKDPENDPLNCQLILNNISIIEPIKPVRRPSNKDLPTYFTWDISNYTNEDQSFLLKVSDGESYRVFGPFEVKTFFLFEFERYIISEELLAVISFIFKNLIQLVIAIITLFTICNYNKVIAEVRLLKNPNQRKIMSEYKNAMDAEEWNKKGLVLHRFHKYDDAIQAFDNALEIDSELPEILNNKGKSQSANSDYSGALDSFDKAIKFDQKYAEAWYNKGITLKMLYPESDSCDEFLITAKDLGYKQ